MFGKLTGRDWAYLWLSDQMDLSLEDCHFSRFTAEQCERAVELCEAISPVELMQWAVRMQRRSA